MDTIAQILNTAWVGTLIGLIGIVLAVLFYLRGKAVRRVAYQTRGARLIGGTSDELPPSVSLLVSGTAVPRLSKTSFVIWNAGNTTIKGEDIVMSDPLRVVLAEDADILEMSMVRSRRQVNGVAISRTPNTASEALITFDFLDPGDGVRLEFLHTSKETEGFLFGTVRGLPRGAEDWGRIPQLERSRRIARSSPMAFPVALVASRPRLVFGLTAVIGLVIVVAALFPDLALYLFPGLGKAAARPLLSSGRVNWSMVLVGVLYAVPGLGMTWLNRRRFPRELAEEERGGEPASKRDS